ncbi:MAG: hypothetical protein AB9866_02970 [Syntrophobacteraceae bacterium]
MSRLSFLIRKCRLILVLVICHPLISSVGFSPEPKIRIHKKSEILELFAKLEWVSQGPYSSKPVPIMPDIVITAPIHISVSDIATPATCEKRNDCRHDVTLGYSRSVQGIHCEEAKNFMAGTPVMRLSFHPENTAFGGS